MNEEIWEPIPLFDGYEISNFGNAKSYRQSKKGKPLKLQEKFGGYLYFKVYDEAINSKWLSVHRTVCTVFNEKPFENENAVIHKDKDVLNNHFTNLSWTTHSKRNN